MQNHVSSLQNYVQTNCRSAVRLEVFLVSIPIYGCCIHAVIVFQWFFRSLPSEVLCIISGEYTRYCLTHLFCHNDLFTLQFYACVDDTFLVPNKSVQHLLGRQWEIIEENIYFCRSISRFISLVFLSDSVALNILSLYQLSLHFENFSVSLFGRFRLWAHTHFPGVICPRYGLGGIIFLIWTAPQCDLEKRVSNDQPYLSRHLQVTSIILLFLLY